MAHILFAKIKIMSMCDNKGTNISITLSKCLKDLSTV